MSGADPRREFKGHQLPRPKRPLDPLRDPFVGNKSVSDNLCEMVQAALWSTLGSKAHALSVNVSETTVTLAGTLDSEAERATAVATAKSVRGIVSVADQIDVRKAGSAPSGVETSPARMVYLRRFCSMDEASTSAAIRQAVSELDALFSDSEILPQNLVVIYSNILGGTVTLDVGVPCSRPPEPVDGTEFRIAAIPSETEEAITAAAGFDGFVTACHELARAENIKEYPGLVFWQRFDASDFRPWKGHPEARIHLAR